LCALLSLGSTQFQRSVGALIFRDLRDLHDADDARIAFAMSEEHDRVAMVSDLKAVVAQLEKRISEEGATTRTHFNVMVERVESAVKLVAEVNAHHATVLDNHENRLQKIEKRA
jgi:hypothetical protein